MKMSHEKNHDEEDNGVQLINAIDSPDATWRKAVVNEFLNFHRNHAKMKNTISRMEKENVAILGVLGAMLLALLKTLFHI